MKENRLPLAKKRAITKNFSNNIMVNRGIENRNSFSNRSILRLKNLNSI